MTARTNESNEGSMKRIRAAAACGALACAIGVGTAAAYLTGWATAENPFTLDTDLKIELTEPSFMPSAAKDVKPMQTVAKDPTVANAGSVAAYVAADVKIPLFSGNAMIDGAPTPCTDAELFSYALNDGWKQVGEPRTADGYRTYRYIYDAELPAQAKTPSIFDAVTLANLTEDVGIQTTSIDITAYAIQAEGFADATEACAAYDAQAHATAVLNA